MPGASVERRTMKDFKKTKVLELYLKHYSRSQIVEELELLGYPIEAETVSKYVKEARDEWKQSQSEFIGTVLERELEELDDMEAKTGDLFDLFTENMDDPERYLKSKEAAEWIKARLKIKDMRHGLLGLKAPEKVQHSGGVVINLQVADCGETESINDPSD